MGQVLLLREMCLKTKAAGGAAAAGAAIFSGAVAR